MKNSKLNPKAFLAIKELTNKDNVTIRGGKKPKHFGLDILVKY